MHTELVEKRRWVSDKRFFHALNYCMLLPGPEAQQLAIYLGWLLHRAWGGIVAGTLFVLPSAFILWSLSFVYVRYGNTPSVSATFDGLKPAVLAIVATALLRIGRKALKNEVMWLMAILAFAGILFKVPFPILVLGAGLAGFVGEKFWPAKFVAAPGETHGPATVLDDDASSQAQPRPSLARAIRVCSICLPLWWGPPLLLGVWLGFDHSLFQQAVFFSKAAMVTFGGAYAVLPYVSQQAVEHYAWLTPGQMLDGLGLAETTPGPLIMVLQFVGFLGGWKFAAPLPPLLAASIGAFITTWCTFVPCFLWIFLGAPHIEQLRKNAGLSAALSSITAAVVGVILNLAVWFGWHVLLPNDTGINSFGILVSAIAFIGMLKWNWNIIPVVLGAGVLGILRQAL